MKQIVLIALFSVFIISCSQNTNKRIGFIQEKTILQAKIPNIELLSYEVTHMGSLSGIELSGGHFGDYLLQKVFYDVRLGSSKSELETHLYSYGFIYLKDESLRVDNENINLESNTYISPTGCFLLENMRFSKIQVFVYNYRFFGISFINEFQSETEAKENYESILQKVHDTFDPMVGFWDSSTGEMIDSKTLTEFGGIRYYFKVIFDKQDNIYTTAVNFTDMELNPFLNNHNQ